MPDIPVGQEDEANEDAAMDQMREELRQFHEDEARIAARTKPMPYRSDYMHHAITPAAQVVMGSGPTRCVTTIFKSMQGEH
jgi:hypothetical protein